MYAAQVIRNWEQEVPSVVFRHAVDCPQANDLHPLLVGCIAIAAEIDTGETAP